MHAHRHCGSIARPGRASEQLTCVLRCNFITYTSSGTDAWNALVEHLTGLSLPMKNRAPGALRRLLDYLGVASVVALLATGGAALAAPQPPSDATTMPPMPMNEQVLTLPGDPQRPVTLQVTLFIPDGAGPFPLAVLNHGAAADGKPKDEPRYRATFSADYFLSRGYAVVLPMMRGFAGSGGKAVLHRCNLAATGLDNARDIAAVIDAMARQPKIDTSRIVVAGQSFGGWNTLAFGTLGRPGVKGLANFSGGIREGDCRFSDQDASLADGAAIFGARTGIPSIWFYGDNDKIFPESTWRAMYARYTAAGARAELVAFGDFMDDAHQLLSHAEGSGSGRPGSMHSSRGSACRRRLSIRAICRPPSRLRHTMPRSRMPRQCRICPTLAATIIGRSWTDPSHGPLWLRRTESLRPQMAVSTRSPGHSASVGNTHGIASSMRLTTTWCGQSPVLVAPKATQPRPTT